ncbi:cysteine peptidase family C39 domain-containing protein [Mucilaginibacter sp. PAMB04168]|uniref:cysteine peptidase family C39 domain-containing protein n=1 Tax=Mucilaginibacter sp. PAMB04168 TaxID=3138567 RepID=UPI0031F66C44
MYNIHLIKRSFIRQLSEESCGLACLGMIFNFSGQSQLYTHLHDIRVEEGGLSLLEMQSIASASGYSAQSVEMELDFLRKLDRPCILHTQTEHGLYHYQVCYGSKMSGNSYRYLMADPAKQVYYLTENELDLIWVSKAALYFDHLKMDLSAFRRSPWHWLFMLRAFPAGFWIIVPLLTLATASFGLAMSWVLQKGMNNSYFFKTNVIVAVVILLFLISVSKSLCAFLRQYLMIRLNMSVNQKLMSAYMRLLFQCRPGNHPRITPYSLRNNFRDIQKIQQAACEIISTVLSEGALLIFFLSAVAYLLPWAALINFIFLLVIGSVTYRGLAHNSYSFAHLNHLSAATENLLLKDIDQLHKNGLNSPLGLNLKFHQTNHDLNINQTRLLAVKSGIKGLTNEILGTINVILVFTIALWHMQVESIDYSTFMLVVILSYLCSTLLPKICNAVAVIAEGADAAVQFQTALTSTLSNK